MQYWYVEAEYLTSSVMLSITLHIQRYIIQIIYTLWANNIEVESRTSQRYKFSDASNSMLKMVLSTAKVLHMTCWREENDENYRIKIIDKMSYQ